MRARPGKAHRKRGGTGQCWATQDGPGTWPSESWKNRGRGGQEHWEDRGGRPEKRVAQPGRGKHAGLTQQESWTLPAAPSLSSAQPHWDCWEDEMRARMQSENRAGVRPRGSEDSGLGGETSAPLPQQRLASASPAQAPVSSAWKTAMTGSSWVVTTSTLRNLSNSMSSWERRVFSLYMISSRWWRPRK